MTAEQKALLDSLPRTTRIPPRVYEGKFVPEKRRADVAALEEAGLVLRVRPGRRGGGFYVKVKES